MVIRMGPDLHPEPFNLLLHTQWVTWWIHFIVVETMYLKTAKEWKLFFFLKADIDMGKIFLENTSKI